MMLAMCVRPFLLRVFCPKLGTDCSLLPGSCGAKVRNISAVLIVNAVGTHPRVATIRH